MTTSRYLNSVLRVLPAVQARQITDLLNDLKATGEVRNAEEYQVKLQELATVINDVEPKPSFKQVRALTWHLATAEAHNTMMKALKNDIEAVFLQVDEVGEKVDDHHFLIMRNLAADMERGLADQENQIRRLEWLAGESNEFSIALVNAFISASLQRISRSDFEANTLYFDNRTYQNKTGTELPSAVVSEHARKLILGSTNEPAIHPLSVRLLTDASSYGTQIQTDIDNEINNAIDGTRGTFWTRDVYLSEAVPKVTTVLHFDLGVARDINYIVLEGATEAPFFVDRIDAIAPDGHKVNLLDTSTEVSGFARIDFDQVIAKGVKITFSVKSYIRAEYFTNPKAQIFDALSPVDPFDEVAMSRDLGPLAAEVVASERLVDVLNIPTGNAQQINSYLYPFALDNVWFGNSKYVDSGVFVSKPLKGNDFGVIAVRANEVVGAGDIQNSIEYDIIKKDISPKFKETRFPIPRLGQTSVVSERLILTKREQDSTIKDAGALRFCPWVDPDYDPLVDLIDPVIVYKNGIQLTKGSDFLLAIGNTFDGSELNWLSNFLDTTDFANYTLSPPKMWIKIIGPDSSAVYTVSYTIRTSDTYIDDNTVWMDTDNTMFLSDGGRVYFRRDNPDVTIESELYLQITLRRNTASQSTSPELREYALLGATYNA
jgi:hypothetical protein